MKILGLIPARGGSKGISRKNLKVLGGRPLIAWSIEVALRSGVLDAVVVSTEDEEIADAALRLGAQVPFLRPAELARDETPGIEPVLHALDQLTEFDAVVDLPPTSPLRSTEDIDNCVALSSTLNAPAVVSVSQPEKHPYWMYRLGADQRLVTLIDGPLISRRQELPPVYSLNGAVYYARVEWLRRHRTFITAETAGYVMPAERSIDLDTILDWQLAELLFKRGS